MPPSADADALVDAVDDADGDEDDAAEDDDEDEDEHPAATMAARPRPASPKRRRVLAT
jgi:hypothetical protein